MYRNGKPYVTFLDGLSKGGAECEAQRLAILWDKFHTRSKPKPATSRVNMTRHFWTGSALVAVLLVLSSAPSRAQEYSAKFSGFQGDRRFGRG